MGDLGTGHLKYLTLNSDFSGLRPVVPGGRYRREDRGIDMDENDHLNENDRFFLELTLANQTDLSWRRITG